MLGGVLVCLGGLWMGWAIPWLVRIELVALGAADVARLGLRWDREGLRPRVRARGEIGGEPLEVAWIWTPAGRVTELRRGATLLAGPEADRALATLAAEHPG